MKKVTLQCLGLLLMVAAVDLTGCGNQKQKKETRIESEAGTEIESKMQTESKTDIGLESEGAAANRRNESTADDERTIMSEEKNLEMGNLDIGSNTDNVNNTGSADSVGGLTYEEMSDKFHDKFYAGVSELELQNRLNERMSYYQASSYYDEIVDYWENTREVRDISNRTEPLYFTDMKYYREDDFQGTPYMVIHLAKNEIYAKHGYVFRDADLNHYFMGCAWYEPLCSGAEFDDSVFNDYEKKNLELLNSLDKTEKGK